jgi:hypothetical protein
MSRERALSPSLRSQFFSVLFQSLCTISDGDGATTHLLFEYEPFRDSTSLYTTETARPQGESDLTRVSTVTGNMTAHDVKQAITQVNEAAASLTDQKGLETTPEQMAKEIEEFRNGVRRFMTSSLRTEPDEGK